MVENTSTSRYPYHTLADQEEGDDAFSAKHQEQKTGFRITKLKFSPILCAIFFVAVISIFIAVGWLGFQIGINVSQDVHTGSLTSIGDTAPFGTI